MNPLWIAAAANIIAALLKGLELHNAPPEEQVPALTEASKIIERAFQTKDPREFDALLTSLTSLTQPLVRDAGHQPPVSGAV